MLDIQVTVEGDKVLIAGLDRYAMEIPKAIDRGLRRIGAGIEREAYAWLSGPGAPGKSRRTAKEGERTGFTKKSGERVSFSLLSGAGAYPVPVRTGNLRGHLDWLAPGQSKTSDTGSFTAGSFEAVVYDSAEYARVIHEGAGSSKKYGPRPYLTDALERFNAGERIKATLEEEIGKLAR